MTSQARASIMITIACYANSWRPVMSEASLIFAEWAPIYRECGFWPRPISPNTKACHERDWQKSDPEIAIEVRERWLNDQGRHGVGLLMGSPFPDGTTLGALDIDHDDYTRIGVALLRDPPCGRVGKKGAVFFVRVRGEPKNSKFRAQGDQAKDVGEVAECLFIKKLCVIPPTIHPDTGQAYRWLGEPLHEIDFNQLPIVEMSND
jgi:Bifunctional DNA primase/polymerase, N-terminal